MHTRRLLMIVFGLASSGGCANMASGEEPNAMKAGSSPDTRSGLQFGSFDVEHNKATFGLLKPIRMPLASAGNPAAPQPEDPGSVDLAERDKRSYDGLPSVWEQCGQPTLDDHGKEIAPLVGAAVAWGVGQLIGVAVDAVNDAIQKDIKSYTTTFEFKSEPFDFYDDLARGRALSTIRTPRTTCFRAFRIEPTIAGNPASDPMVMMDFVGQLVFDPNRPEVIGIRPLRLFYAGLHSKGSDHSVAVNLKLAADVYSLSQTGGLLAKSSIDASLVHLKIDAAGVSAKEPFYKVFSAKEARGFVVPLPAWDFSAAPSAVPRNSTASSLVETQVSNVPWLEQKVGALFAKNKDDLSKELTTLANGKLGLTKSSTASK